ncbi:hypothetical protein [Nocardia carnea]|uniref:hypothetical protein n=1 Tax=Nocardia carnea TaxID=37328 RepID=UPI002453F190|nr:hypothetical protein [Nocardia carnea]
MTDRPVEDDIMNEVRKFGHSMAQLMRMHAQAATWRGKHKIRRQISLELRRQRRQEQTERAHHLSWTSQMIHRYRQHVIAVDQRAADPRLGSEQYQKDAASVARHGLDLRQRIVANSRLTPIEQGIALDGIDSATAFPYADTRTPMLFARAHKVRGINALRYRARVAREMAWFDRQQPDRAQAPQPASEPQVRETNPFVAEVTWTSSNGEPETATREYSEAREGLEWAYAEINHTMWTGDTRFGIKVTSPSGRTVFDRHGGPDDVADDLEQHLGIIRTSDGIYWQKPDAGIFARPEILAAVRDRGQARADTDRFETQLRYRAPGAEQETVEQRWHAGRAQALDWTATRVRELEIEPSSQVTGVLWETGRNGPLHLDRDDPFEVSERLTERRNRYLESQQAERPPQRPPAAEQARAEVSASELEEVKERIRKLAADQEKRDQQIAVLERGLEAVTEDRDALRTQLDAAEARVQALEARNRDLGREADRYRGERDDAVRKIAQLTPPEQRYGSRVHREAADNASATEEPTAPQEVEERGHDQHSSVVGRRASFLKHLRDTAAHHHDDQVMSERLREWVQNAPDEVLLSYGEKKGLIPPGPSTAPPDQIDPALREAIDREDCLRDGHTQPWPASGRNGHHRNGIERSR